MAISENIKLALDRVQNALVHADTGVRALRQAEGDHHPGNGLVDFHAHVVFHLTEVVEALVVAVHAGVNDAP